MSFFELITSQSRLDRFCRNAASQPALFLDTEFVRTRTLKPKLGLIQAYDGDDVVMIDPLADIDLQPFWALLTDTAIVKVLHSCSEDLEVFKCYAKCQPTPLFDTQVAAGLLAEGQSIGYGPLVDKLLGIALDKGEARTNWLARPLSDAQLEYAAKDVLYLKDIYGQLTPRLEAKGFYEYVLSEGELAVEKRAHDKQVDDLYLDIKGAWRLAPVELAVLRQLAAWRYQEATKRDLALNFVVKEANLITIARHRPQTLPQLKSLSGLLPQEIRYHGKAILENVQQALALPSEQWPEKMIRLIDFPGYKSAYRQLKALVDTAAEQSGIPVESLASKRQINQVLSWLWKHERHTTKPDLMQNWRAELLGERLFQTTESLSKKA